VTNRYAFRAISSLVETKVGSERTGVDSLFLATRLIPRLHTDIIASLMHILCKAEVAVIAGCVARLTR